MDSIFESKKSRETVRKRIKPRAKDKKRLSSPWSRRDIFPLRTTERIGEELEWIFNLSPSFPLIRMQPSRRVNVFIMWAERER